MGAVPRFGTRQSTLATDVDRRSESLAAGPTYSRRSGTLVSDGAAVTDRSIAQVLRGVRLARHSLQRQQRLDRRLRTGVAVAPSPRRAPSMPSNVRPVFSSYIATPAALAPSEPSGRRAPRTPRNDAHRSPRPARGSPRRSGRRRTRSAETTSPFRPAQLRTGSDRRAETAPRARRLPRCAATRKSRTARARPPRRRAPRSIALPTRATPRPADRARAPHGGVVALPADERDEQRRGPRRERSARCGDGSARCSARRPSSASRSRCRSADRAVRRRSRAPFAPPRDRAPGGGPSSDRSHATEHAHRLRRAPRCCAPPSTTCSSRLLGASRLSRPAVSMKLTNSPSPCSIAATNASSPSASSRERGVARLLVRAQVDDRRARRVVDAGDSLVSVARRRPGRPVVGRLGVQRDDAHRASFTTASSPRRRR